MKKALILFLVILVFACSPDESVKEVQIPAPEKERNLTPSGNWATGELKEITLLEEDDELFQHLTNSESLKAHYDGQFGQLNTENAFQLHFENTAYQIVGMPLGEIDEQPGMLRVLTGVYIESAEDFIFWVFELLPEGGIIGNDLSQITSGAFNLYNLTGSPLVLSSFRNSEIENFEFFEETSLLVHNGGEKLVVCEDFWGYVYCSNDCMAAAWNSLSWLQQVLCGAATGGCIYTVGGLLPACLVAAGCVTPLVIQCNVICYYQYCE